MSERNPWGIKESAPPAHVAEAAGAEIVRATVILTPEQEQIEANLKALFGRGFVELHDLYYAALDFYSKRYDMTYVGLRNVTPKMIEDLSYYKPKDNDDTLIDKGGEKLALGSSKKLVNFIDNKHDSLGGVLAFRQAASGLPLHEFMGFLEQFEPHSKVYQLRRIYPPASK
jgi:hypothetical protein